jgi:hypothetical protein
MLTCMDAHDKAETCICGLFYLPVCLCLWGSHFCVSACMCSCTYDCVNVYALVWLWLRYVIMCLCLCLAFFLSACVWLLYIQDTFWHAWKVGMSYSCIHTQTHMHTCASMYSFLGRLCEEIYKTNARATCSCMYMYDLCENFLHNSVLPEYVHVNLIRTFQKISGWIHMVDSTFSVYAGISIYFYIHARVHV